jgi:hypothetical protein
VKSQAQTSGLSLSWRRMASRVGSAAAWSRSTSGSVCRFTWATVLTSVYIVKYQYSGPGSSWNARNTVTTQTSTPDTSETIHETVREHYAAAAVAATQGNACCSDPETIGAML